MEKPPASPSKSPSQWSNFNSQHNYAVSKIAGKQTQQKKSFLHHLRAAAKKLTLIFTVFGSKSKKDAPQDYQDYGIKHSSQTEPNSWNRGDCLELAERLDIAIDVAHAITYLHSYNDPPIIHRDIKASNVLITEKLRAKVADFGLARLLPDDADVTHISTQIKGTVGYLDAEYMRTYQLTEKSDVYSFGILLVELVTGRHPLEPKKGVRERITARWAMSKLREGMPVLAMDPRLNRSPASIKAIEKVLRLALKCIGDVRPSRPSMKECVEALWAIRKEFKESAELIHSASHKSVDLLEKDARKTRRHALGIEEESYTFMSA